MRLSRERMGKKLCSKIPADAPRRALQLLLVTFPAVVPASVFFPRISIFPVKKPDYLGIGSDDCARIVIEGGPRGAGSFVIEDFCRKNYISRDIYENVEKMVFSGFFRKSARTILPVRSQKLRMVSAPFSFLAK